MGLSDDQRALLRLLAQREEGYEDIAALKGMSVAAVRDEVRAALAALEAPTPEPPPAPPTPAPEPPPAPVPAPPVAASGPPAPVAQKPAVPVERRRFVAIAGGALAIVAIVLGAIAIFGSDDSGSDSGSGAPIAGSEISAEEEGKVTQAVLTSPDGGDAAGRAVFGRVGKEEVVLQVTAENLEPTEGGQSYTVWLYRTPKLTLRVGSVSVGEEGNLGARFAIPTELLAYVASGAFDQIYISRTEDAAYQAEVKKARKNKSLPRYIGETALTGKITGPIAKSGGEGSGEGG